MLRTVTKYKLPNITYPKECSSSVNVYITPTYIRLFTKYDNETNSIIFNPLIPFVIGSYTVSILLDNNMGLNSSFSFNLDVYDKPRLLKDDIVYEVDAGNMKVFRLPIVEEFGPIIVKHDNLPSFAKFIYPNYLI
jgi:hypothetical protein